MAGEMVIHRDVELLEGTLSLGFWCALVFVVESISLKSMKARVLLDGEPTIVVKKGHIVEKALRRQRLNLDDLTMLLRTNQVFSILEVEYAILEPNGDLSVMKKAGTDVPPEPSQPSAGAVIPTSIIVDGEVIRANLREYGLTEAWLYDQLNAERVKDILYAELQKDGNLYVQKRG